MTYLTLSVLHKRGGSWLVWCQKTPVVVAEAARVIASGGESGSGSESGSEGGGGITITCMCIIV